MKETMDALDDYVEGQATTRKADAAAGQTVPHERIAERAYEISQSERTGSDEENWLQAERELRRR